MDPLTLLPQIAPPSKTHEWENIDAFLSEVADELTVGQIVGAEKLGLYEAMSALEIMDVKMDAGCNTKDVHTLEEALLLKELAPSASLSEVQIIGAIDRLLVAEMMYLEGYSCTQTVYTCLYMHSPENALNDAIFAPYAYSLLKRCALIHSAVITGDIYEEEDFSRHMSGLTFYDKDEKDINRLLAVAEESLCARLKALKGQEGDADKKKELEVVNALLARLRFARGWQQSLRLLTDRKLDQANKALQTLKPLLETIASTTALGEFPAHLFQQEIARRLEIPTHPRKVIMLTFEETLAHFTKTIEQLQLVLVIEDFTKLDEFRRFIVHLVDDGAGVLVRSFFMKFTVVTVGTEKKILGKYSFLEWLIKEAKEIAFVPDPFFKYAFVEEFLKHFVEVYICYLSVCCMNKARRRRKLPFVFRELSGLSELAYQADTQLARQIHLQQERTPYFLLWVLDRVFDCMIHFLKIGFDLELYAAHEMKYIFWYLYQLSKTRKEQHFVLLRYDQHQIPEIQAALIKNKKKVGKTAGKGTTGKSGAKNAQTMPTPHHNELTYDYSIYKCFFFFLQGLETGRDLPKFNFGSEMTRYNDRFNDFFGLMSPPPYHFDYYCSIVKNECESLSAETLLNAANTHFKEAKSNIEKLLTLIPTKSGAPLPKFQADIYRAVYKNLVANGVNVYMILNKKTYIDPAKRITVTYDSNFVSLPNITLV